MGKPPFSYGFPMVFLWFYPHYTTLYQCWPHVSGRHLPGRPARPGLNPRGPALEAGGQHRRLADGSGRPGKLQGGAPPSYKVVYNPIDVSIYIYIIYICIYHKS